jgi:hypothetical protein
MLHTKNLCLPKPSIVAAAAEGKTIHISYFQDSKDHKIERTWRDEKENCEKLNISCGLSARTRNTEEIHMLNADDDGEPFLCSFPFPFSHLRNE